MYNQRFPSTWNTQEKRVFFSYEKGKLHQEPNNSTSLLTQLLLFSMSIVKYLQHIMFLACIIYWSAVVRVVLYMILEDEDNMRTTKAKND